MSLKEFLEAANKMSFMGIPGDVLWHFGLGALLGWLAYMILGSSRRAFFAVLILSVAKELVIDLKGIMLAEMYFEPVKDVLVSVAGGFTLVFLLSQPFKSRFDRKKIS